MGDVGGLAAASPLSLTAVFEEVCPIYMSFGMTYEQFWDGDVSAHKMYRKAMRQRVIAQNRMLWIQGMYIYDALLGVGRFTKAFSKAKPAPYPSEPYDLFAEEKRRREEREQKERYERIRSKVQSFAKTFNEKRQNIEKNMEVNEDGRC